jgi:DNA topoisomerase-1
VATSVVVVESPAKAKTINKYLGPNYRVFASYGHVRDLPAKDGSVRPDEDFAMTWDVDAKSNKHLKEIADAMKSADELILATDPDREGEAISWHVLDVLRRRRALKDVPVRRVVFNAITKQAVSEAMKRPREIDEPLVEAYLARRALDYLVGFTLSPVLWRKLPGARSAGRVQSVALRLVCDREAEIERFVAQEYWNLSALLGTPRGDNVEARLVAEGTRKLGRLDIGNGAEAGRLKALLQAARYTVEDVEAKPQKRHPQPPFTTSTLQQEASRKLGFGAARTMQVAQRLYEGVSIGGETVGLITYMRTDAVQMAPEGIEQTRRAIADLYGPRYLPGSPRHYATKAKNAQEAHEAVRPTELSRLPDEVRRHLDPDQARLYELIWKRTIASQMESAEMERTTATIAAISGEHRLTLRATGTVVKFDGFLTLYQEGRDDEEDEADRRLPELRVGEALDLDRVNATQHFTEPPPRYTEASLVKKMEELGIGRPSTYAAIMQTLRDRDYVELDKKRLVPQDKGRLVTAFLESFFKRYVEYDFTAALEEDLDRISSGQLSWKEVLRRFWEDFSAAVGDTSELRVSEVLEALNEILGDFVFPKREDGGDPRACPSCDEGRLSLKLGRYGAFIGCSNYPECRFTRQLTGGDEAQGAGDGERTLGLDPETGEPVLLKSGRFGPYVETADPASDKPKRSGLPRGMEAEKVDLETALRLLSLPRVVGTHPETGQEITAGLGRYGPFIKHEKTFANLESIEDVFTVGLNRAVSLLAEKAQSKSARGQRQALKELGEHPTLGGPIRVMQGRYGPYVTHEGVNATLPRETPPEAVTMEEAVALLAAKGAPAKGTKGKSTPRSTRGKVAAKSASGEAPKRKPAAKAARAKSATAKTPARAATKRKAADG